MLQEQLANALIREIPLDPARVLVIRARGSFREGESADYHVINGDDFSLAGGYNVLKHRRYNARVYQYFNSDVLQRLSPDFEVYSAMYTYWFLWVLKTRAARYHIMEDGFGSYQTLAEQRTFFENGTKMNLSRRLRHARRLLARLPEQKPGRTNFSELLQGAATYVATSRESFPWAPADRKVVPRQAFLPRYLREYDGAYVLATSCFVESGFFGMEDYLPLLRRVLEKIVARNITLVYLKFHPAQAANRVNLTAYRGVLMEFDDRLTIKELPQGTSIESLAAGNDITFITGVSTLAFHVESTGAKVLSYLNEVEKIGPHATSYLAKGGMDIFRRITTPL